MKRKQRVITPSQVLAETVGEERKRNQRCFKTRNQRNKKGRKESGKKTCIL